VWPVPVVVMLSVEARIEKMAGYRNNYCTRLIQEILFNEKAYSFE